MNQPELATVLSLSELSEGQFHGYFVFLPNSNMNEVVKLSVNAKGAAHGLEQVTVHSRYLNLNEGDRLWNIHVGDAALDVYNQPSKASQAMHDSDVKRAQSVLGAAELSALVTKPS